MKILSADLGKFKSVFCVYDGQRAEFQTVPTERETFSEVIRQASADVVVFETCTAAGWVADLCEELGMDYFVANPNGEAWRWSKIKRKTDRDDALKLARLTAMNELPTVHVPSRAVRAKRSLLKFREQVVRNRVAVQNEIRALWQAQGLPSLPSGKSLWTVAGLSLLSSHARPLSECSPEEFWRGQLGLLLESYAHNRSQEKQLEQKLEALAKQDASIKRLQTIPGVGRCTAEVIVSWLDDPTRFRNGREVSSYAGLVPVQYQSGESDRRGRITRRGSKLLRKRLVECTWLMMRYNPWAQQLVQRISKGQRTRKKQAIVAVARRLLVRCWAMLRDGTDWQQPKAC